MAAMSTLIVDQPTQTEHVVRAIFGITLIEMSGRPAIPRARRISWSIQCLTNRESLCFSRYAVSRTTDAMLQEPLFRAINWWVTPSKFS
ncbi:hypothetical protein EV281_103981 [Rhizobium sp. BK418]|nr:hypothetical protein EV281_103981 [Rhizobium sp. BK418]